MDHTAFTLQIHHIRLLPSKHSPDGATMASGSNHLITAYYSMQMQQVIRMQPNVQLTLKIKIQGWVKNWEKVHQISKSSLIWRLSLIITTVQLRVGDDHLVTNSKTLTLHFKVHIFKVHTFYRDHSQLQNQQLIVIVRSICEQLAPRVVTYWPGLEAATSRPSISCLVTQRHITLLDQLLL